MQRQHRCNKNTCFTRLTQINAHHNTRFLHETASAWLRLDTTLDGLSLDCKKQILARDCGLLRRLHRLLGWSRRVNAQVLVHALSLYACSLSSRGFFSRSLRTNETSTALFEKVPRGMRTVIPSFKQTHPRTCMLFRTCSVTHVVLFGESS